MAAQAWETVHLFISSTFNDMHGERDYLVKEVFPELRDWCEERKLRLVDIDLRWGVSEADATHNQRVVDVCLQNIDRCRPFFLCFLGQRYGWIPGAGDVSAETLARYPGLQSAIAEQRSVTELEVLHAVVAPFVGGSPKLAAGQSFFYLRDDDYLKDMPAEPAQLQRIYSDEAEEEAQSRAFLVDRRNKLRAAVVAQKARPARQYSARWLIDRHTPELSMPLDCPATLRENQDRWRRDWQRSGEVSIPEGALSVPASQAQKARAYNQRLCAGRLGDFCSDGRSLTEVIVDDLKAAILERYPERGTLPEQDDLSREVDRHEDFVRTAADVFIEREGDFADLDAYAGGDSRNLFALVAKAGLGKSTLLANWVARWRARDGGPANETVHARFVGVGERSNNVDSLLRSILEELRRTGKLTSEIPDNPNVLRSKFCELLGECGKNGRTVIVIDALNQLQSGLSDLDWLARTLPENVKLVVSFKLGDAAGDALAAQLRADERVTLSEVRPFAGLEERRHLVRQFLRQFLKELDEQHLEALIQADGADNPLFLKVVLTELRVFGAFGQLGEVIRREFGTTPQSAFEAVLRRLESDPSYAAVPSQQAVPLLFGLLAHSRGGLPEDLLARMFLGELGFGENRSDAIRATIRLFLRQVRPFLARREGRVDFFYESFQLAAKKRYTVTPTLSREAGEGVEASPLAHEVGEGQGEGPSPRPAAAWHGQLARACDTWHTLTGAGRRYALGNLARHQVAAGHANQAAETLTEFGYHYERLKALGREDVVNVTADFALVDGAAGLVPAVGERLGVWKAFHAGNAHMLRRQDVVQQTSLLQLAVAHADTSPVTESAERWLEAVGSENPWLHSQRRPHEVDRSRCFRTFEGHTGWVQAVAFSFDGKRLLSGSFDRTLRIWDVETGQCLRTIQVNEGSVRCVACLPDKRRVLSGGYDGTLRIWDMESGRCLQTLRGHGQSVDAVVLLPDSRRILSGSMDRQLKLWDSETGQCLRSFQGHTGHVDAVAVSRDGKRALSGSHDKTLRLWDIETGECLRTFEGAHGPVAFLRSGRHALSAGDGDYTLRLWDVETGQCLRTFQGHTRIVSAIALLGDSNRAFSASEDASIKLWDLETGLCLQTFSAQGHQVKAVASQAEGRRIVFAGGDVLMLWDLEVDRDTNSAEGHTGLINAVALSSNGQRAISGGWMGNIEVWDIDAWSPVSTLAGHTDWVTAVAIVGAGRAVSASRDGTLKVWDLESAACLRTLEGHTAGIAAFAVTADRRQVLSASDDKSLKLWDIETGRCLRTFEGHSSSLYQVSLFPEGRRAISRDLGSVAKIWDIRTGECVATYNQWRTDATGFVFLADGRRVLTGSWDHTVKLWDIQTDHCLRTFLGHAQPVDAVAVLPGDHVAISGSRDDTLKVWDIETGLCLATWQARGSVTSCAVGPDGIVIGTHAGEVLFLKLMPPGRIVPETTAATWYPSRPLLAVARANGTLLLQAWHPESQYLEELARTTIPSITSVQWSADGAHLLATTHDGAMQVLDAATLLPSTVSAPTSPFSAPRDISPDGRWRAVIEAGQLRIVPATEA